MEVIRVPEINQFKPVPRIRVRTYFILHEHLDESLLHNALDRLIRDHWRKLGARLATRREDGLLEYHLPRTFGEKDVLFKWTSNHQEDRDMPSMGLPNPTPPDWGITLQPHTESIEHQLSPSDWPVDRGMEMPGSPLLFVHLSYFGDGSCLALNCPHALSDQFGLSNILRAWLGMVQGEKPPPMLGYNNDLFSAVKPYADYPKNEVTRKGRIRVRRPGEYPLVISAMVPDLVLRKKELSHTLFIPLPLIQSLHERHTKELKEKYGTDAGISHNDIIAAILVKFSRIHHRTPRMMSLSQTISLRTRFPPLQGNDRAGYIHNGVIYSTARFSFDSSMPIREIARLNRQAMNEAIDLKDAEISVAVVKEMVRRGQPNLIAEPFDRMYHVSNWTAAWKGLDFTCACVRKEQQQEERRATEFMVLGSSAPRGLPMRFNTSILCKTPEGYWLNYGAPVKAINMVKNYLKDDPKLEKF